MKKAIAKMRCCILFFLCAGIPGTVFAEVLPLKPRVETQVRAGTERTIATMKGWIPLAQAYDQVIYTDLRMMGDDRKNREWNLGLGYRRVVGAGEDAAVMGVHGWLDRRRTARGSVFYQAVTGVEYLGTGVDTRINAYLPFSQSERYTLINPNAGTLFLADTGVFVNTNGELIEKPLHGADVEFSIPLGLFEEKFDDFRVFAGGFVFSGSGAATAGMVIREGRMHDNIGDGLRVNGAGALSFLMADSRVTGNGGDGGVFVNGIGPAGLVDLGGGALNSAGGNWIFGNSVDLRVNYDGRELKAENNWWGDANGLQPAQVVLTGGSTVDADPFISVDPQGP